MCLVRAHERYTRRKIEEIAMSMMRHEHQQEPQEAYRYDAQTVQKVMTLATRLQQEHQQTMTPA
jgi:hypothetical protein